MSEGIESAGMSCVGGEPGVPMASTFPADALPSVSNDVGERRTAELEAALRSSLAAICRTSYGVRPGRSVTVWTARLVTHRQLAGAARGAFGERSAPR